MGCFSLIRATRVHGLSGGGSMKPRKLRCKKCNAKTMHQGECKVLGVGLNVSVTFNCLDCGTQHIAVVTKDEYFDRPATEFHCEECRAICSHEISRCARGKKIRMLVVLHCTKCNREVRKAFKRKRKIPREFFVAERSLNLAAKLAA